MNIFLIAFTLVYCVYGQMDDYYGYQKRTNEVNDVGVDKIVLSNLDKGRFIGCTFIDLCPVDRKCYNDLLFGTCLSKNEEANFVYDLSPELEKILEIAMKDLFKEKFRWTDFYTQCFLQSVMKSSEMQKYLDIRHCKRDSVQKTYSEKEEDAAPEKEQFLDIQSNLPALLTIGPNEYQAKTARHQSDDFYKRMKSILDNSLPSTSSSAAVSSGNEEKINPLTNSEEAVSTTTAEYEDPKKIRKELNIAKRKRSSWIWLKFNKNLTNDNAKKIIKAINDALKLNDDIKHYKLTMDQSVLTFKLPIGSSMYTSNITNYLKEHSNLIPTLKIVDVGSGHRTAQIEKSALPKDDKSFIITFIICCVTFLIIILVLVGFCVQKFRHRKDKLGELVNTKMTETTPTHYVSLFRSSSRENSSTVKNKQSPIGKAAGGVKQSSGEVSSPVSTRSSTSSWTDELPNMTNMDIYTGHMILSYMEKHLKNKEMFQAEWKSIEAYETDSGSTTVALDPVNAPKNRYQNCLPYDKSRVVLKDNENGDYINASYIMDHDPKVPAYIASQAPMKQYLEDFWQMVWQQGVVVIVNLTEAAEAEAYWPQEGAESYKKYEVNLVSEHVWSDEYLVRNFYLKSVKTGETRTVSQFHYLRWQNDKAPPSSRSILEFRRKVNKSYRSKTTPILIHCSDGCGRTGTYILLDLILNRIGKGMKEMDIAATLEHLRDQRISLVKTEEQFGFVLNTISEEVNTILKLLNN